jgi:hypothetical protein
MNMKKALLAILVIISISARSVQGQIVINEYCPANISIAVNGNTSYDDWIEIYNAGSSPVNLAGYGLTDDISKPYQFRFPSITLNDDDYLVIFANGKDNSLPVHHWETAVKASTTWKYFVGSSQPDTNWRNLSFNDAGWSSGTGGIGYGDGDDQTTIPTSSKSVMMRKTFFVPDTADILRAIFNIDYDDGFVAFLNGTEIARANLGIPGNRPNYDDLATSSHEAVMYQGHDPDSFNIDPDLLRAILIQGVNVLAVEVHNTSTSSNDLSAIPFLTFGMAGSGSTFSTPPSWFGNPAPELLTANFKLTRSGESIYLVNPSGTTIDQQTYTEMQSDHSWGRKPDGSGNWCLFKNPTPDATNNNSTCYNGYAAKPVFSLAPGFYSSSHTLTLTNSTPGGVIRYSTNGDDPTTSSSVFSSGSISLSSTKTVRAKVFASGYLPSPTVTNTYVINENIKLPVFCITTDYDNLWDNNTGIYVLGPNADPNYPNFGANFWQDWRKPAAIEYYDRNKNRLFNFNAEIAIFGNYSRAKPQKSMEIILKDKLGQGSIDYPIIPDKPQLHNFDNFVLRNSGTDWNAVHFRDALMERVLKPTHTGYLGTEPAVMYLNGQFWGVFTIHENHDHHWMEYNYGIKQDEMDYLKEDGSTISVKNGSANFFWDSYNYATTQNASSSSYYNTMNDYWDLDNYKDYFIAETYYNNGDWIGDWTNNIKIWRPLKPGGKLRYLVYDLDFGLGYSGSYNDNRLAQAINPAANSNSSNMFDAMLGNPQFKREFINRYADLINTIFKPSNMIPIVDQFKDSMAYDMPEHFAKWGSSVSSWNSRISSMESFINNRPAVVRNQIKSQFNLNKQVTLTFNVSPAGAGRIQVSTIVPTSYPWTGVYFDGNPVTLTAIPNPGYTFDKFDSNHAINNDHNQTVTYNFSSTTESITAFFTGSSQTAKLVVSEFNYNSAHNLDCEDWIELHNYGTIALDLSGWMIKDENDYDVFTIPVGTVIPANGYLVVAADLAKFATFYPAVTNVIGPLGFKLSNDGDQVRLYNPYDQLFLSFYYQDLAPWPVLPDGQGFTCELTANTANPNDGNSWFAGCLGGSPGRAFTSALSTVTQLSGNTTFCTGGSTTLTLNNTPGYTYQWRRNNVDIPSATDTFFIATQSGTYTVRASYQGCSAISDTLVVNAVTSGQPPVVNSVSRCGEGSVTLTATATDSVYWFDAPNGNLLAAGNTFYTPTLTGTTTYYAQTSLSCPSAPVAVDAIINLLPADPVVSDITRCGPGPVVINAVDTATVNWYNAATSGAIINTGNIFVTGYIPHDTTFYVEAVSASCISERVAVNVSVTSSASPLVHDVSRCGSGSVVLTASSLAPVFWYDSLIGGSQVGSGVNLLTPVLTQTRKYYAESNNGCASPRVQVQAIINDIPSLPVTADSTHCGSGPVNLFATANYQIFWYASASGGTALGSGSNFTTPNLTGTATYYAEAVDICSSGRTPVNAIIEPLPPAPVGSGAALCGSGIAQLSATASNPIYWFENPTGGSVVGTGNAFTTPYITATTVYYAAAIANCTSTLTPVTALVAPIPVVNLGNDTTIVSGASVVLHAGPGFDAYLWSTGQTTQTITVNATGVYSVEVWSNGCNGSDTVTVSVVLGIQESNMEGGSVHVYPNPVKDRLTLELESRKKVKATLILSDMTGKILVSEEVVLAGGMNTHTINLENISSGIYFFTLRSEDFTKTMSLVVE